MEYHYSWTTIVVSLVAALALTILPLPEFLVPGRPDWVALTIIYWLLMAPGRIGLVTAVLLGLCLDTLSGSILGQHALALLTVAYLTQRFALRIRVFPVVQMSFFVLLLLLVYHFVLFWIDGVTGESIGGAARWLPLATGAIVWPLLMGLLDNLQQETRSRV